VTGAWGIHDEATAQVATVFVLLLSVEDHDVLEPEMLVIRC
jgi:hypothetical protein